MANKRDRVDVVDVNQTNHDKAEPAYGRGETLKHEAFVSIDIDNLAPGWNRRRLWEEILKIWRFASSNTVVIPLKRRRAVAQVAANLLKGWMGLAVCGAISWIRSTYSQRQHKPTTAVEAVTARLVHVA
ncbi:hypothetical protein L6654_16840 [Bradyrhizobium sp. WYCCWR 13023]|uniref:Uncharacterized protein n=1 Tax=Bradyrhizobium zhengyangense TaxID=2911009 RepID=A0A9X1RDP7_9BRAD|nr:hypothetical protein [Bradyrhizobium zhengyangense]MCG2628300.1 hypothetical protein [Bradyrhizobium zhengyangense]